MPRLIDADEAYIVLTDYYHQRTEIQHKALKEAIERVPTIEAEPIRHGRWIMKPNGYGTCSNCHKCSLDILGGVDCNYCPHCGALMDGDDT